MKKQSSELSLPISLLRAWMCAKSLQSCPTLYNPRDYNPPVSSVHGVSPARILEWVAISYARASSQSRDRTNVSCVLSTGRQILYHQYHLGSPIAPSTSTILAVFWHLLHISKSYADLTFFNTYCIFLTFCAEPINNVVIVSGGQQRDSAIHTHASVLLQNPPPIQAAT